MVPRFITLSLLLADRENWVPSGLMYPRLLPGKPLSESLELAERPDIEDTDDAVETERSSRGTAPSAGDGVAHTSGEEARSCGGEGVVSIVADRGVTWRGEGGCAVWRSEASVLGYKHLRRGAEAQGCWLWSLIEGVRRLLGDRKGFD